MAAAVAENFQLKWHSFGSHLHASVATLLHSETFADVILSTADGRHVSAHRFVLAACSSYLQGLLGPGSLAATGHLPVVVIMPSEISHHTLCTLVKYMYSGEATVSQSQLDAVLRAGDILRVRGLYRPPRTGPRGPREKEHAMERDTRDARPREARETHHLLRALDGYTRKREMYQQASSSAAGVHSGRHFMDPTRHAGHAAPLYYKQHLDQHADQGLDHQGLDQHAGPASTSSSPSSAQATQRAAAAAAASKQRREAREARERRERERRERARDKAREAKEADKAKEDKQPDVRVKEEVYEDVFEAAPPAKANRPSSATTKSSRHQEPRALDSVGSAESGASGGSGGSAASAEDTTPAHSSTNSPRHRPDRSAAPSRAGSPTGSDRVEGDDLGADCEPMENGDHQDHERRSENGEAAADRNEVEMPSLANLVEMKIKEEPIEWDMESEVRQALMEDVKPTLPEAEQEGGEEPMYSPLTCDYCHQTFASPAEWVHHIENHAEMRRPARRRGGKRQSSNDSSEMERPSGATSASSTTTVGCPRYPELTCEICHQPFSSPQAWIRHLKLHSEEELAKTNQAKKNQPNPASKVHRLYSLKFVRKRCPVCNKSFPSHASMMIHKRTHTGERPYVCSTCGKGFNVKSNLLRHLRTLHDLDVSPGSLCVDGMEIQ